MSTLLRRVTDSNVKQMENLKRIIVASTMFSMNKVISKYVNGKLKNYI